MNDISIEQMALGIPILGVLGIWTLTAAFLLLRYLRRRRLFELFHEERMAAIAKGVPVPALPEALLFESGRMVDRDRGRALLKGLIGLFTGGSGYVVLQRLYGEDVALWALVPIGIGLAYIVYYFVEGRRWSRSLSDDASPRGPVAASAPS